MGFRISYAVVNLELMGELMGAVDLTVGREASDFPDWYWSMAKLDDGRFLLWNDDPNGPLADPEFWAPICSPDDTVLSVSVNETSMVSRSFEMSSGIVEWTVEHDWQVSADHLAVDGMWPPEGLSELVAEAKRRAGDSEADHLFDVPVELVRQRCGFRYDTDCEGLSRFARLRPAATLGMLAMPQSCVDEALRHFGLQRTDDVVSDVRDAHWTLAMMPSGLALLATSFRGTPMKSLGDMSLFAGDETVWKFQLYESAGRSGLFVGVDRFRGAEVEAFAIHQGWEGPEHLDWSGEIDGLVGFIEAAGSDGRCWIPLDVFEDVSGWVLGEAGEHMVLEDVRVKVRILDEPPA